jgi:hypothetical protein
VSDPSPCCAHHQYLRCSPLASLTRSFLYAKWKGLSHIEYSEASISSVSTTARKVLRQIEPQPLPRWMSDPLCLVFWLFFLFRDCPGTDKPLRLKNETNKQVYFSNLPSLAFEFSSISILLVSSLFADSPYVPHYDERYREPQTIPIPKSSFCGYLHLQRFLFSRFSVFPLSWTAKCVLEKGVSGGET